MKRCPHCEFIYDDDQSLCDMDGKQLVHDSALTALTRTSSGTLQPSRVHLLKRILLVTGVAVSSFAALLSLAYYAPSQFAQSDPSYAPPAARMGPAREIGKSEEPIVNARPVDEISTPVDVGESEYTVSTDQSRTAGRTDRTSGVDKRLSIARNLPPLPRVPPLPRLAAAKVEQRKLATSRSSKTAVTRDQVGASVVPKKDSKLGSFLKKTGRIIKKPFKL